MGRETDLRGGRVYKLWMNGRFQLPREITTACNKT